MMTVRQLKAVIATLPTDEVMVRVVIRKGNSHSTNLLVDARANTHYQLPYNPALEIIVDETDYD